MSTQTKDKLPHLKYLLYGAILLFIITLVIYFLHFHEGISNDHTEWGTFGDFMGGTLNPIFAIFSLAAILYTIKIQTEELELSRKELEATRGELKKSSQAQQEQSESFKIQNESIKLQSFENTFFQLMNLFLKTKENLKITIDMKESKVNGAVEKIGTHLISPVFKTGQFFAHDAITEYMRILETNYVNKYDDFNKIYENFTGTYFIQVYQVLKFIKNSQIQDKQFYINLLRAQFSKKELRFLFYHCLGSVGKRKFKPLIEEFEFFEHIELIWNIEANLTQYSEKAFGKNEMILSKQKELKNRDQG